VRDIRPLGAITRVTLRVPEQTEVIEVELVKDHPVLAGLQRGSALHFLPRTP